MGRAELSTSARPTTATGNHQFHISYSSKSTL